MVHRILLALIAVSLCDAAPSTDPFHHGELHFTSNNRYFMYKDGAPFFYMADTAWEMLHLLTREDISYYLENRHSKDFNVIEAAIVTDLDGVSAGDAYGDKALFGNDAASPNEAYFKHVDFALKAAEQRGMYLALMPIANAGSIKLSPDTAYSYGRFLGTRYRKQRNIFWILGGGEHADAAQEIWRKMAEGLRDGDRGTHLITYQPQTGAVSSDIFPAEPVIDFNLIHSGGSRDLANDTLMLKAYTRTPVKPVMDGGARFEDEPVVGDPANGRFDDFDVRQAAYWAVMAGAAGHVYGCNDVWQFYTEKRKAVSGAHTDWRAALDMPGTRHMSILKALMESRAFWSAVPDPSVKLEGNETGPRHARALRANTFMMIYLPYGDTITLTMGKVSGRTVTGSWFNPRDGSTVPIGSFENTGTLKFKPPSEPARGNDWVLLIDGTAMPEVNK